MPDHRFNVLTPIVLKVREKTDLKPVRKSDWFKVFESVERMKNGPPLKGDNAEAVDLMIEFLLEHLPTSDVGGKQLRADAWRRLRYLESVL
ncbi:hypothetical protein CcrBL47_gp448 [Caulobacter phage BL47]|nr:hypothetical protein CcrBL47_gp448 [Caulobacter phage BL47]